MSLPADPRKKITNSSNNVTGLEAGIANAKIDDSKEGTIHTNTNDNENTASTNDSSDEVILATAGYDHTIKFWQAHTGQCIRTLQHADSQVLNIKIIFYQALTTVV